MTKLAESSGTVVHESGSKLYISKRPAQWTSVFLFVTIIVAVILAGNGIVQIIGLAENPNSTSLGLTLIGLSLVFFFVFWRVKRYRQKIQAIPVQDLAHVAIFDLENNTLLDGQQNILVPLNNAWLTRKMQLTSSSPELIMQWNGGSISIVKGSPFSGGIGKIEKVLISKGIRKK